MATPSIFTLLTTTSTRTDEPEAPIVETTREGVPVEPAEERE